jgi:uncharacterized protein Yka (UPF0111/DUF47 family)
MEKTAIATALDERGLLVPGLLKDALAANERAKYYLSLLQLARAHADTPEAAAPSLAPDRERAGIPDVELDRVVERATSTAPDAYRIPRVRAVARAAVADVEEMIAPLHATGSDTAAFDRRLASFEGAIHGAGDTATRAELERLTGADRRRDSLHLLVVDVHKALDAMGARIAPESIGGASVWGIELDDRPLVAAFAEGVRRTEKLRFGHPGLGTTAARYGGALVIENDIGATDAHVIVVHVTGLRATITTSDVHVPRIAFLERLLEPLGVQWVGLHAIKQPAINAGETFYQRTGSYDASSRDAMIHFLGELGASLVFLIDWNRARKQLQQFVSKGSAVDLLDWAAHAGIGHRAFLEEGGADLVFRAMAAVLRAPVRFGERLDDVLGGGGASAFLRFVLRESTEGLLAGRSRALLRERVRAELAAELAQTGERLLEPVLRHGRIVLDLAAALRDAVQKPDDRLAADAKRREREADEILVETRAVVARIAGTAAFQRILESADDAADDLEEASFRLTLLDDAEDRAALAPLADLAVKGATAYVEAIERARHASSAGARDDVQRFLDAVERSTQIEREADDAEREAARAFLRAPAPDARPLIVASAIAHALEEATDALAHAALVLRDHLA